MSSRRFFLGTLAAGLAAAAFRARAAKAAPTPEFRSPLGGPLGLQLWSVQRYLAKDVAGTLARVRALGVREVETAGTAGMTARAFRAALGRADLVCRSMHVDYERLRDEPAVVLEEAKVVGATYVVCPWIPHDEKAGLTREATLGACALFDAVGNAARREGLRLAYHCHGYEFVPSGEGTLWETLVRRTDPSLVSFEIDVFWARAGGADPAGVIAGLAGRVPFLHIKDMRRGLALPPASSSAPEDADVPAGAGQLDFPAILRAARAAGTQVLYVEDESPRPWEQVPVTLRYISGLALS